MVHFLKNCFLVASVLMVSFAGVGVGQSLTRHGGSLGASLSAKVGSAIATPGAQTVEGHAEHYENLELFNRVLQFILTNYVDPVKHRVLIEGAIKGMLETLDPHSNFLPADLFKDMQIDTTGKFGGLGIEIGMKDNILTILAPIEDTPAWSAGLKPNDRIVKINGESTKGMNLVEAVSKMRGKAKTDVTISIYRDGFERIKDIKITREVIRIQSVKNELLEPQFAYLRLTTFNENAAQDVKKAIEQMQAKKKIRGLVFDLRTNPGGLLDQAVEVASLFIDEGVIVSTIGRNRDQKDVKYAHRGMAFKDFPVAVLVNSSTASAAEIVAGALQDHHRAIIMGQSTFGKGSVQTVIPLPPDMGLKLTIARYYTPSGRSIQEKGVAPDVILDEFDSKLLSAAKLKYDSFRERDLKGHMVNTDGTEEPAQDFKKEELEALTKETGRDSDKDRKKEKAGDKSGDKAKEEADEMTPYRLNPKEDYQVKQALIALKSFEAFTKAGEPVAVSSSVPGSEGAQKNASPKQEPQKSE